ncbi:MAG: hypothetical protein HY351_00120 [Candidatus Omnitrophica bacterium]|nr:hypothetical protein [Candidatus Omnitrophota bacterium]
MISSDKIKELILQSLKNVKDSDPIYQDWVLAENTVVLGATSRMDSIAFTAFAADLEEKIEEETKREYLFDIDLRHLDMDGSEINLSVDDMAKRIASTLNSS